MAVEAGLLEGTSLVTRPLVNYELAWKICLAWRRGTGRREEFQLLAKELTERVMQAREACGAVVARRREASAAPATKSLARAAQDS
jgi:hypothetical protein